MKRKKLLILSILFVNCIQAQQLTPQTLNNEGSSKSAGGLLLEDALGGLLVSSVSTSMFMYTEGFLQPDAGTTTNIPVINNVVLSSGSGLDNSGTTLINKDAGILLEFTVGEFASITLQQSNNMITQGILQPFNTSAALPVTGLEFYAKRISNSKVQLDWKTIQEIDNRGFYVERKKESEINFKQLQFVKSAAPNGNASLPLTYQHIDTNTFAGKTYYRLKQEDIDGKFVYSTVRLVSGSASKIVVLKAWPIPAQGNLNVVVEGIEKDVLQVFDLNGKLVQQFNISNGVIQKINRLTPGTYLLRLAGQKDMIQKVIVQ